jgi:hypothetical protein
MPLAARSKAPVCSRSFAGIAGTNTAGAMDMSVVEYCVCCQVEVSATGRLLFQESYRMWCLSVISKPQR